MDRQDEHIGVLLTQEQHEKLEDLKSLRRGRAASKSAIIREMLDYFFAMPGEEVYQILNIRTGGQQ